MTTPDPIEGFAEGAEPLERAARLFLYGELPRFRFDIVDEDEARRALSTDNAGHILQDVMVRRAELLGQEVRRMGILVQLIRHEVGLALVELDGTS